MTRIFFLKFEIFEIFGSENEAKKNSENQFYIHRIKF